MHRILSSIAIFASGLAVGAFLMQPGSAQTSPASGLHLNHVAIAVKDLDESIRFYTQNLGFREVFRIPNPNGGKPTMAYLQTSRDTFIEVQQSNADRPVGVNHIGISLDNFDASLAALREHGLTVDAPRSTAIKVRLSGLTDPDGVHLELLDLPPGSPQRKAMDEWKQ